MRERWLRDIPVAVVLAAAGIGLVGCGVDTTAAAACRSVGICDPSPEPVVTIDVLCDSSRGSSCSPTTLATTLDVLLQVVASRPGSTIRLWAMGNQVAETTLVATASATKPPRAGSKARKAHEDRFVESSRAYLLKGMEARFSETGPTRTPLAESLARVASANPASGNPRLLLVIGDCREFSEYFDFECGALPTAKRFLERLQRDQIVTKGSMKNTQVIFSYVGLPAVDGRRCPATMLRAKQTEALWRAAMDSAGATGVHFADTVVRQADLMTMTGTVHQESGR